jgi:hypothetical protein
LLIQTLQRTTYCGFTQEQSRSSLRYIALLRLYGPTGPPFALYRRACPELVEGGWLLLWLKGGTSAMGKQSMY